MNYLDSFMRDVKNNNSPKKSLTKLTKPRKSIPLLASLIVNTFRAIGGKLTVDANGEFSTFPKIHAAPELWQLLDEQRQPVIALLDLPPNSRPTVKGYLQWLPIPGAWVWSECPHHFLLTRATLPAIMAHRAQQLKEVEESARANS